MRGPSREPTAAHLCRFCGSVIFPSGLWMLVYVFCASSRLRATEDQCQRHPRHCSRPGIAPSSAGGRSECESIAECTVAQMSLAFREGRERVWIEMRRVKYKKKSRKGKNLSMAREEKALMLFQDLLCAKQWRGRLKL